MGLTSPWHWLLLILVVVLLFGSKRLPDAARGLGRSLRILKSEVKQMHDDDSDAAAAKELPSAAPAAPAPGAAVTENADPKTS